MGIKNAYKLYASSMKIIKESELKNCRIGVDASYEIYRASLGARHLNEITDSKGTNTICINVFLCNIIRLKKMGVKGLLYIFDNPGINEMKIVEQKKRKEKRDLYTDNEKVQFKLNTNCTNIIKNLLKHLGIGYITAPLGIEAEQLAAFIKELDIFITADFDALLFGNKKIIRKSKKGKNKYEMYELKKIISDNNISKDQFIKAGIVLGCDFAPKTPRIGIKTVFKKLDSIELTNIQKKAFDYFKQTVDFDLEKNIVKEEYNKENTIKFLTEYNFNKDRVEKMLKGYE